MAKAGAGLVGRDLVSVIPSQFVEWKIPLSPWADLKPHKVPTPDSGGPHVVALDYGMKWNIARYLFHSGCRVTIMPGTATAKDVLALEPDGIFLSNGPGDPEPLGYAQETIRGLLGKKPNFGICLGHQLLSLACGAKTFTLKFGHRGANQPVLNKATGRVKSPVEPRFAVDPGRFPRTWK